MNYRIIGTIGTRGTMENGKKLLKNFDVSSNIGTMGIMGTIGTLVTIRTLGTMGTKENRKNFYKNFDDSRKISVKTQLLELQELLGLWKLQEIQELWIIQELWKRKKKFYKNFDGSRKYLYERINNSQRSDRNYRIIGTIGASENGKNF